MAVNAQVQVREYKLLIGKDSFGVAVLIIKPNL